MDVTYFLASRLVTLSKAIPRIDWLKDSIMTSFALES